MSIRLLIVRFVSDIVFSWFIMVMLNSRYSGLVVSMFSVGNVSCVI